ncbi:glucose-6-phosphate dehydrogenase [Helicobacter pylori UM299]|uniref:glucose-6-phosphate dehydrogenase n=1 Tax=Helicobacter pylori TaxID=210 RepID=UPI000329BC75|nr:glucose-6-phosphate dehydrogenase [Helicobacter pylori]AGL66903.1 glucose-6-phosphate dehydrogenase [Helicobacter pylori UM032]AGL67454.1 glucose-6-phosphate dehydrogenase [Helicobacter pylori UM299]AGR62995.1 glucose-6-phosphate dehydrogenase [Helicobacter pylori UM298]
MLDFDLVLFGATGDLAMRKLFVSLYEIYTHYGFKKDSKIIASGRKELSNEEFLALLCEKTQLHSREKGEEFLAHISYFCVRLDNPKDFEELSKIATKNKPLIFYFSISPSFFATTAQHLAKNALNHANTRLILEKPLGHDLKTCKEIFQSISTFFKEEQIFRIDHYLGKKGVQNILELRLNNPILNILWDQISAVEICVYETLGVEERGEFYDKIGALRDMVQNHLLQVLSLIATDLPNDLKDLRKEKIKVLKTLQPPKDFKRQVIRAQYQGYRDENKVHKESQTETFVAIKAFLDTPKFKGVPFYLKHAKKMPHNQASAKIHFNAVNTLEFFLSQDKITLTLQDHQNPLILETHHKQEFLQPYAKLLYDAIQNNHNNFAHQLELEASWVFIDTLIEGFMNNATPLYSYESHNLNESEFLKPLYQ